MKYCLTFKSTRHETADSLADPEREKEAVPEREKGVDCVDFIGLIRKANVYVTSRTGNAQF